MRLRLQDATQELVVEQVRSFVGEDASGSFGILSSHDRFITCLEFGMARFQTQDGQWNYLAVPGAVLRCLGDELILSCRHFVLEQDYRAVRQALEGRLAEEEEAIQRVKSSLQNLEEELLRRLRSSEA